MNMLWLACLLVGVTSAIPDGLSPDFLAWAKEHRKHYTSERAWQRAFSNYKGNEKIISNLNMPILDYENDEAEYAHTRFSDMTPAEFQELYLPSVMDATKGRHGGFEEAYDESAGKILDPPPAVDWRAKGAVTPVKDQSSCGSCWAESAVSNIESIWYLANQAAMKAPVPLSVEQVIECDAHDYACYGGYPKGAYEYTISHGGLVSEADYPFDVDGKTICLANQTFNATCGDGMCDDPPLTNWCDLKCRDKTGPAPVAHIKSWKALPQDEVQIAVQVAEHGPVSVGIDASGMLGILFPWLQFYKKGVANPKHCSNTKIDHAVLIVGYGTDGGNKYWTIKNSWGTKWGESGYFRLIRGEGKCGIATMATTSIVGSSSGAAKQLAAVVEV